MKKCSDGCIPCCDFCIHCLHAYAADGGGRCEPMGCTLHRDYEHQCIVEACGDCDDFYCFRAQPSNADRIRGMTDEALAKIIASESMAERIPFCQNKPECDKILKETEDCIPESMCVECVVAWLQSPAETEGTE